MRAAGSMKAIKTSCDKTNQTYKRDDWPRSHFYSTEMIGASVKKK